jgi:hypothetical protein
MKGWLTPWRRCGSKVESPSFDQGSPDGPEEDASRIEIEADEYEELRVLLGRSPISRHEVDPRRRSRPIWPRC